MDSDTSANINSIRDKFLSLNIARPAPGDCMRILLEPDEGLFGTGSTRTVIFKLGNKPLDIGSWSSNAKRDTWNIETAAKKGRDLDAETDKMYLASFYQATDPTVQSSCRYWPVLPLFTGVFQSKNPNGHLYNLWTIEQALPDASGGSRNIHSWMASVMAVFSDNKAGLLLSAETFTARAYGEGWRIIF